MPRVTARFLGYLLWRAFGDDFAAFDDAFEALVDGSIRRFKDVEIMFHHHNSSAVWAISFTFSPGFRSVTR